MKGRAFSASLGLALAVVACGADELAGPADPVGGDLHDFFLEREQQGFSGVVSLARGNDSLLLRAYGSAGCSGEPLSTDHVFLIGSIVKVFTKAATYSLVADGNLQLDDSIAEYLEDVPDDKSAITVRMLAAHTSGLDDTVGENGAPVAYTPEWDYQPVSKAQIVERGMRSALLYEPGTDRRYSNLAYSLLAAVIERAAGEDYESYVHRKLFEPLGMDRTGYVRTDWSRAKMAHGCRDGKRWTSPNEAGLWMHDGPSWNLRGNGGMLGTVNDLALWLDGLARTDVIPGPAMTEFMDDISGQSRTFGETATAFAGGNGIVNAYVLWLIDSDIRLIMISNHSDHQVESYLDAIFPLLKTLRAAQLSAEPISRH